MGLFQTQANGSWQWEDGSTLSPNEWVSNQQGLSWIFVQLSLWELIFQFHFHNLMHYHILIDWEKYLESKLKAQGEWQSSKNWWLWAKYWERQRSYYVHFIDTRLKPFFVTRIMQIKLTYNKLYSSIPRGLLSAFMLTGIYEVTIASCSHSTVEQHKRSKKGMRPRFATYLYIINMRHLHVSHYEVIPHKYNYSDN